MKTKEQVIKWLEDHNVFDVYIKNVLNSTNSDINHLLTYGSNMIGVSFQWDKTPEGIEFWSNLDKKFIKWYNEIQLPKTINEFHQLYEYTGKETFITNSGNIDLICNLVNPLKGLKDANTCNNEEIATSILCLMQLIRIRDYYNDGWKPNWKDIRQRKYIIGQDLRIGISFEGGYILAFKTEQLAEEFLNNFKSLIKQVMTGGLI